MRTRVQAFVESIEIKKLGKDKSGNNELGGRMSRSSRLQGGKD
jgi:hypothetical protein